MEKLMCSNCQKQGEVCMHCWRCRKCCTCPEFVSEKSDKKILEEKNRKT